MSREFFKAVTDGNVVLIREMLDVDPALASAKDEKGLSAILKATYYGKKEVAALLLESQVELNIFEAAATGQTQRVRELIKEGAASVNVYSADGFFPLALAVFFGHLNTVEVLLAAGADINAVSREAMKVAPINSAAANGQLEIARVLIAHGANVDAQAVDGFRPLHEAAARGNIEFAALLLANGADINAKTATGKTPLAFALEKEQTEMAALLRGRGGIA